MKKLVLALGLVFAVTAKADVVLDKASEITTVVSRPVTIMSVKTNAVVLPVGAKVVWTSFVMEKLPPKYEKVSYRVFYFVKDTATGKEVPGTRGSKLMSQVDMTNLATRKGIAIDQIELGMERLANAVMRKEIAREND